MAGRSDSDVEDEDESTWPALALESWHGTRDTLHMWTQIVGKVRLALSPPENHWWHVPFYLTARGLTTSPIPYPARDDPRAFEIDFDFLAHELVILATDGQRAVLELRPRTVADFYGTLMGELQRLGIDVAIWPVPVEIPDPIRFDHDDVHGDYDPVWARRFWRVLLEAQRVLRLQRDRFLGKSSPIHFFWGSFDLACTRFSGREAPPHPSVPATPDFITREAYSHEVWSGGFWPGDSRYPSPIFYAYAYPEPAGFRDAPVQPSALARYEPALGEHVLPYESARLAPDPDGAVETFLESSYLAAATLGRWPRAVLEREQSNEPLGGAFHR